MNGNGAPLSTKTQVLEVFQRLQDDGKIPGGDSMPAGANLPQWPRPLSDSAYIGIAGDAVRLIEPESESDPAALLVQFLVLFGSLAGRGAHWQVESTDHFTNLFVTVVGDTSVGRKGTGLDRVRACFNGLDPEWDQRIVSGLSSGEGIIWHIRDPITEPQPIKDKGRITGFEVMETDPGIEDKRLLVIEAEFARVLASVERQGSTLSPIMRDAWDGKPLAILTKQKAARCGQPHVSVITHITADELQRMLSDTSVANGFLNRFLLVGSKRSKVLPFGGRPVDFSEIRTRLAMAADYARNVARVDLHQDTRQMWSDAYMKMTEGRGGLFGAVIARGPAIVMRLALLFALLDQAAVIRQKHLAAALELWRYCSDTARFLFGSSLGDPVADQILESLRAAPGGLTRKQITVDVFGRHKSKEVIGLALSKLVKMGKVRSETEQGGGRPVERWFAV